MCVLLSSGTVMVGKKYYNTLVCVLNNGLDAVWPVNTGLLTQRILPWTEEIQ